MHGYFSENVVNLDGKNSSHLCLSQDITVNMELYFFNRRIIKRSKGIIADKNL